MLIFCDCLVLSQVTLTLSSFIIVYYRFHQNEVLQMYHIYTKTAVQCINMLIELKVQIVPYISLKQLAKLCTQSDSHDIVDKTDHSN